MNGLNAHFPAQSNNQLSIAPAPSPSLEVELSELHNALNILESESGALVGSLHTVSHSVSQPVGGCDQKAPSESLPVALAEVRVARERVHRITVALSEARIRIAL